MPPFRSRILAVAIGTSAIATATPAVGAVDFAPRVTVATVADGALLAAGHLDGDGILDLVVTNSTNTVAVHRGLGGGNFAPPTTLPVGAQPVGVALGDYNADGFTDIATANSLSGNVSVVLGNGNLGAIATHTFQAGQGPLTIAAGRIDADADLDLVVTNLDSRNATFLLGNGDGTFAPSQVSVGDIGLDAAVGDVTGDGVPDLVTTGLGVRVFAGPVSVPPAPSTALEAFGLPFRVITADLNGDGRPDLATANINTNDMSVSLSQGGGSFSRPVTRPASAFPSSIAAGDVNGDGIVDLVVANTLSGDVSVYEGAGGGGFKPSMQFRTALGASDIVVTDVTADGRADILAVGTRHVFVLAARSPSPGIPSTAKVRVRCVTPRRVVLHEAVACVEPLMSQAMVREFHGPPATVVRAARSGDIVWRYRNLTATFHRDFHSLIAVRTTQAGAGTTTGVRVGSPARLVKQRFPRAVCRTVATVQTCTLKQRNTPVYTRFTITRNAISAIEVGFDPSP